MGPGRAIVLGLLKTGQTWGRATRREFWWFAPVGLSLPVAVGRYLPPDVSGFSTMIAKLAVVTMASLPLLSAAARRFHDTGRPAGELLDGLRPTLLALATGWLLILGLFGVVTIVYSLLGLLIVIPAFFVFIANIVLAPGMLGLTIGQLLMPPDPGPNRYGPDPRESFA